MIAKRAPNVSVSTAKRPPYGMSCIFFFSSRRRHTRFDCDWSSDVCSSDLFDKAVAMIKEGKRLGYYVCTNTTVYRETDVAEIEEMCAFLTELDVDGILLSPEIGRASCRERV